MEEFDLEDGLKPVVRPKLTDFCSKCRLEVPRAVRICPRCGFDIEGFRMLGISVPAPPKPAPPPPPRSKVPVVAAIAGLAVLGGMTVWLTLPKAKAPEADPALLRPVPARDQGYQRLDAVHPVPTEPAGADDPSRNEPRPQARPATGREAAPALGRSQVAPATPPPAAALYHVVLTDGTIYDAIEPPGDGAMVTLRLTSGKNVVVYRSDIDLQKTRDANSSRPAIP